MFGRKYQWLIMGTYGPQWWKEVDDSSCSSTELATALEGCILTDYVPLSSVNITGISGYVSALLYCFYVIVGSRFVLSFARISVYGENLLLYPKKTTNSVSHTK